MVVVEVRQGTLRMDGSDWGPAPNNVDRGSQLDEEEEDEEEKEEKEKEEEEEEKRKAADIKSNNPHLAGGEKKRVLGRAKKGPFFLRQGPEVVRSSPPGMLCNPILVPNICESLPFYHFFWRFLLNGWAWHSKK